MRNLFSRTSRHKHGAKGSHKLGADEVFWPLDLLPEDCKNSRILTWGYDSMVSHFFSGPANQSNISAHAKNLLQALKIRRLNCVSFSTSFGSLRLTAKQQGRSVIFVAHSLGGKSFKINTKSNYPGLTKHRDHRERCVYFRGATSPSFVKSIDCHTCRSSTALPQPLNPHC